MKKLSLNLNELKVDTFEINVQKEEKGTVKGNQDELRDIVKPSINVCVTIGENTCMVSCNGTCVGISCVGTCHGSCHNCTTPDMFC